MEERGGRRRRGGKESRTVGRRWERRGRGEELGEGREEERGEELEREVGEKEREAGERGRGGIFRPAQVNLGCKFDLLTLEL